MKKYERDVWDTALTFLVTLTMAGAAFVGCTPIQSAAEADYTAEQLACVDQSATRDEATACRNAVKARWAAKDAGAQ